MPTGTRQETVDSARTAASGRCSTQQAAGSEHKWRDGQFPELRSYGVLKPGGVLVSTVWVPAAQEAAERHGIRVEPFFMHPSGEQLETLARLVDAGTVRPFIDRAYSLDETADALRHSASKRAKGKIVIRVS
ncbi:zinc-binding dehydrogenase [Kitasatospora sp. NPDC094028]